MNEIKCPNCGKSLQSMKVNTANSCHRYGQQSLTRRIHERIRQELALAEQKALNEQQEKLAKKDQEIAQLQNQIQQFDTEKNWPKKRWSKRLAKAC